MLIRQLTIKDYDNFIRLIQFFRPTYMSKQRFQKIIQSIPQNQQIWVMEQDTMLIATASVIYETKFIFGGSTVAHIEDVCTDPAFRHMGLGSLLLQHIIQEAKSKDCYKIVLTCDESIASFYKKNGFESRGIQCSQLLKTNTPYDSNSEQNLSL